MVLAVAACGTAPGGPVADASPVSSSGAPSAPGATAPAAGVVRDSGTPLTGTGGAVLLVAGGAGVEVGAPDDGASTVTATGPAGVVAWVAPPRGGGVEPQGDGSVVVRDAGGGVVAALGAPTSADGAPAGWRVHGEVLALDAGPGAASFVVGTAALVSATWGEAEGGRSLAVVPGGWVRVGSLAAQAALAAHLEAAEPEAATPSMRAQLWCHALGAPDKDAWNLEPWRPDVGTVTMIATRCNPTDDDV